MFRHRGKQVGMLRDDGIYISYRTPKHYFRIYDGFGITISLLKALIEKGCSRIVIIYRKTPNLWVKYTAEPMDFMQYGITYQFEDIELQKVLPIKYFKEGD